MRIERTTKHSILPEAIEVLTANRSVKTFHADLTNLKKKNQPTPMREPLGIYNVSLNNVLSRFVVILDALESMLTEEPYRQTALYGTGFEARLLDSQEALLKSIQEHFDDCRNVLRCFYPPVISNNKTKFENEPVVDAYWNSIKQVIFEPVSNIVNFIKHEHGRLRFFVQFNDDYAIPGYFLEAVSADGVLISNRAIHEPIRSEFDSEYGCDTAFSFYRDLRYLLWGVYHVSYQLATAIEQAIQNYSPRKYASVGIADEKVIDIVQRIAKLPLTFYEDESHHKDAPTVEVETDNSDINFILSYPGTSKIIVSQYGAYDNLRSFVGDGVSDKIRLPYKRGRL